MALSAFSSESNVIGCLQHDNLGVQVYPDVLRRQFARLETRTKESSVWASGKLFL